MARAYIKLDGKLVPVDLGVKIPENEYYEYAKSLYTITDNSDLFDNAWEHSLGVDVSEIEKQSEYSTQYGRMQYPDGEQYGVIIPEGVSKIGDFAFYSWRANNHPLVIPNSVTSIGDHAFSYWRENNQPLVIPNSVTSIGSLAFNYWQVNNQPLVIPDSVTSIGSYAFDSWKANNQPLVIPNSVRSIGSYAFRDWNLVPYVEIKAVMPPSLGGSSAFVYQNNAPIYVPDESLDDYKTATNWVSLASRIFPISSKP